MSKDAILKGRYKILKELRLGSLGKTYAAIDLDIPSHPPCLVKQLDFSDYESQLLTKACHLFEQGAKILEKLGEHPQIPQLLAYCERNKKFYIVQEFISGKSLDSEILPGRTLPENQVVSLITEILEILVFVHQNHVIHGNIKPENLIRRQSDSKLVLLNLEAVKEIPAQLANHKIDKRIDTPGYRPREQEEGNPQLGSDIYAVGMIGVQALTGELPSELPKNHQGVVWRNHAQVSSKLADVIDKMVRENPEDRYQSAQEVLEELKKVSPKDISLALVNTPALANYLKNSRLMGVLGVAAVVVVGAGISTIYMAYSLGKLEATEGSDLQLLNKSEANLSQRNYEGCLNQVKIIHQNSSYYSKAQDVLKKCADGVSWKSVEVQTFKEHSDKVWDVAFSPDQKTFASSSRDQTIKLWDWPSMKQLNSLEKGHTHSVLSIAFSPDSRLLASGGADMKVNVWKPRTDQVIYTEWHAKWVWSVAISPNGKTLASSSEDKSIKLWNLETGTQLPDYKLPGSNPAHTSTVYAVAFSPDGKTLVSGSADKTIKIWDLVNRKPAHILSGHTDAVRAIAITPDGQTLVSGSWDKTIKVWNLKKEQAINTLQGHSDKVTCVAISPDGKTLASGSADQTIKIWDLPSGKLLNTLMGHSGEVLAVAFSRDGKALASGGVDKTVKIWQR